MMPRSFHKMHSLGRSNDHASHVRLNVAERRRHRRSAIHISAILRYEHEAYVAELIDISAGGAQLRCALVPRIGAVLAVETKEFGVIEAKAVRRFPRSLAVEFDLPEEQQIELADRLRAVLNPRR